MYPSTNVLRKPQVHIGMYDFILSLYSTSSVRNSIAWRRANGYPDHFNERGVLTDGPDFSYEDGQPTPYGTKQRNRILTQRQHAEKIVKAMGAVEYAQERHRMMLKREAEEMNAIVRKKLKWKGGEPVELRKEAEKKERVKFGGTQ